MVLSFKVVLGGIFWAIAIYLVILGFAGIVYIASLSQKPKVPPKKPKYEGQPIIVKGGKKDAK